MSDDVTRVFVLGAERSGSTWISNVLEAHPEVELFLEPCTDELALFADLAHRNRALEGPAPEHSAAWFRDRFDQLARIKYPYLYRRGGPAWLLGLEAALVRRFVRLVGMPRAGERARGFFRLQLHTEAVPTRFRSPKRPVPGCLATKELRLNFKAPLLTAAFPAARFVVMLRHPGAQLASIERLLARRSLVELRAALVTFREDLAEQPRLRDYLELDDGEDPLPLWWLVNHDVLLSDLRAAGVPLLVLRHEQLAADPGSVADELLEFSGLTPNEGVAAFVRWSTTTEPRSGSPLETVRKSLDHSRTSIAQAPPATVERLARLIRARSEQAGVDPALASYADQLQSPAKGEGIDGGFGA